MAVLLLSRLSTTTLRTCATHTAGRLQHDSCQLETFHTTIDLIKPALAQPVCISEGDQNEAENYGTRYESEYGT